MLRLLRLFGPCGEHFVDLLWPLDLSAAFVAVLALKEDFALAILAEKPLLLLKFLGNCDRLSLRIVGLTM